MIEHLDGMLEDKRNIDFTIYKGAIREKYRIKMKLKNKIETRGFQWEWGAILGGAGFPVSHIDYPKVFGYKDFNTKKEAEQFIEDLPDPVEFFKLRKLDEDK